MERRYWLTGASNGIGASLAEALLQSSACVALSPSQSAHALCQRFPGQVLAVPGNLTNSQSVREVGEKITQQWGTLDTVIINAGTSDYLEGQPGEKDLIEHLIRSNLLAASFCIEAALPLLQAGRTPHLVGIASPVTYLAPSRAEGSAGAMRHVFESVRPAMARKGIDVTLVTPGLDDSTMSIADGFSILPQWTAGTAASYLLAQLSERPHETTLPAASMTALWPLPTAVSRQADSAACLAAGKCPIKGQP